MWDTDPPDKRRKTSENDASNTAEKPCTKPDEPSMATAHHQDSVIATPSATPKTTPSATPTQNGAGMMYSTAVEMGTSTSPPQATNPAPQGVYTIRIDAPRGCSLPKPEDFLLAAKTPDDIIGAYPYATGVEITYRSEVAAMIAAASGFDVNGRHFTPRTKVGTNRYVSAFVPIEFPDKDFETLMQRYGDVVRITRLHYKQPELSAFENGVRLVTFTKIEHSLPARLTSHGVSLGFRYTGQPPSCLRCSEIGHTVKTCTRRRAPRPRKPKAKEAPAPPPAESLTDLECPAPDDGAITTESPAGSRTGPKQVPENAASNATLNWDTDSDNDSNSSVSSMETGTPPPSKSGHSDLKRKSPHDTKKAAASPNPKAKPNSKCIPSPTVYEEQLAVFQDEIYDGATLSDTLAPIAYECRALLLQKHLGNFNDNNHGKDLDLPKKVKTEWRKLRHLHLNEHALDDRVESIFSLHFQQYYLPEGHYLVHDLDLSVAK